MNHANRLVGFILRRKDKGQSVGLLSSTGQMSASGSQSFKKTWLYIFIRGFPIISRKISASYLTMGRIFVFVKHGFPISTGLLYLGNQKPQRGVHPHGQPEAIGICFANHINYRMITSMKQITVLLTDDNAEVRKAFSKLLKAEADLQVVGEAKNGKQAVTLAKKLRPAVVLMDVAMPLMNGIEALRQIIKAVPATKVVMLSTYNDDVYIAEAMSSGAVGYLIKYTAAECVCEAIRETNAGRKFFSPSVPKRFHQPKLKKSRD